MKESSEKPAAKPKRSLADQLRGRGRMAVTCIGGMLLFGLMGVGNPLSERIESANKRVIDAASRSMLAGDVVGLRHQAHLYRDHIPRGVDLNEWTQYLLDGVRAQRVKLLKMEPKDSLTLGPCRVLAWQIEIEGQFESLARVVAGIENGPRLVRIDQLKLQTPSGQLTMSMMVRGLTFEKAEAPPTKGEATVKKVEAQAKKGAAR